MFHLYFNDVDAGRTDAGVGLSLIHICSLSEEKEKENTMYKKFEMELAGRTLRVDVDRVAKQANGAVLMHYGEDVYKRQDMRRSLL